MKPSEQIRLENEYKKQIKRIKRFIKNAEKRGYKFSENTIPKKPKNLTEKSIQKLDLLRPKQLYKKAKIQKDGKTISGTKGRQIENRIRIEKATKTRQARKQKTTLEYNGNVEVIDEGTNFKKERTSTTGFSELVIQQYQSMVRSFIGTETGGKADYSTSLILSWLDRIISSNGIDDTADMIQDGAKNGVILTFEIMYNDDLLNMYMLDMLNYLPEAGELFKEELMESMEQFESWEDIE